MDSVIKRGRMLLELSVPLIAGVVLALLWANLDPAGYAALVHWSPFGHHSHYGLHFAVNDLFMAFFFGIAAGEIREATLPGGALNPPRKAINPLLGTAGGILGPVAVYFAYVHLTGHAELARGWGIPTATDIAIAWLVARFALGAKHPAVSFLLLLAVADDGVGLGIIAVFYPDPAHPVAPQWLALVGLAAVSAYGLRKADVKSFWPYLLGPGVMSWFGLHEAHLHPALALVPVVPLMPAMAHDEGIFADESAHDDTLNRFQAAFKIPVDLGLFAFGLVNAGVVVSGAGAATAAVVLALLVGKTVGIFGFAMAGRALGFPLPDGMNARSLFVVGVTAGLGLTVALFVSGAAFQDPVLQGAAKLGALLSVVAAPLAIVAARILKAHEVEEATSPAPTPSLLPVPLDSLMPPAERVTHPEPAVQRSAA